MSTTFDVSLGRSLAYVDLIAAAGSEELVVVPLETTGLESDSVLQTYASIDDILTNNTESTIGRLTASTMTLNGPAAQLTTELVWAAPSGNPVGCLVFALDPTGSSPDADLVPMWALTVAFTPDGLTDFAVPDGADLFQAMAG